MSPTRPLKICTAPGCHAKIPGGTRRCGPHQAAWKRQERLRSGRQGSEHAKMYGRKWRAASKAYLLEHPWCVVRDCRRPSGATDHIVPHRGDVGLFWDVNNWQALCKECHDEKTGRGE